MTLLYEKLDLSKNDRNVRAECQNVALLTDFVSWLRHICVGLRSEISEDSKVLVCYVRSSRRRKTEAADLSVPRLFIQVLHPETTSVKIDK